MMILTSEHCLRPIVTTTAMNTLLMAEGSYDFISFAVFEHGEITKFMQYVAFLLYLKAAVGIGMAFFLRTLSPLPKRSPQPPAVARSPVRGDHRGEEEEEGGGTTRRCEMNERGREGGKPEGKYGRGERGGIPRPSRRFAATLLISQPT